MTERLTYSEQLKHPMWQRRRLECLEAGRWICSACYGAESTLHVHHRRYIKGRLAWDYEDDDLQVLCEGCHALEHERRAIFDRLLVEAAVTGEWSGRRVEPLEVAIGLLAGWLAAHPAGAASEELLETAMRLSPAHWVKGVAIGALAGVDMAKVGMLIRETRGDHITPAIGRLLAICDGTP